MNITKTMEEMKKFNEILSTGDSQPEDREYIRYFSLKIAQSIISDLGDSEAIKIANVILSVAEKPYEVMNKDPYMM